MLNPSPAPFSGAGLFTSSMQTTLVFSIHDSNGNYWPYLYVSLRSVLLGSKPQSVWVLHDQTLTDEARQQLELLCASYKSSITFGKVTLPPYLASANFGAFSAASIFRLGIPKFFKDHDQVVYLDCDLVFNGVNINELLEAAGDAPLAAIQDPYIGRYQRHRDQLSDLGLDSSNYFNSGVLVMRPKLLPDDLIERFQAFCKQHPVQSHPDQDFLNLQFKDQWKSLDSRFNYQACTFDNTLFQPISSYFGKVIHYAGKVKPLQGSLAPAFIPFWMHAAGLPKLAEVFDQAALSYLEPEGNTTDRVRRRHLNLATHIQKEN
jgi:lipopolysaccharide biosynthesis glycosyltransferase